MKIAVLSGKGGTGKTFVSVNLANAIGSATYIDCDVEEPNGRLFLKSENNKEKNVYTLLPKFDFEKCNSCRKCVDFCNFNALVFIKNKPKVFPEICHSCGGCAIICPEKAIDEEKRLVGIVEQGKYKNVNVITGILNLGEASAVPVIKEALNLGFQNKETTVIDCPPGSGCSVMESVMACDCAIIVAEPTAFGFHNFKMVHSLVKILNKPCFVVINKEDVPYEPLEKFCADEKTAIIKRIPYNRDLANLISNGKLCTEENPFYKDIFSDIFSTIKREICQ